MKSFTPFFIGALRHLRFSCGAARWSSHRGGAFLAALGLAFFVSLLCVGSVQAAADLYMKDTPADTGAEPNPDLGAMYVTEDIWVRQNPISGYQPYPFGADPAWLTAVVPLHENPEYRDPKYSKPNYLYIRVRNRGSTASAGTERLRVYWAKASTGLSWPSQWVDYLAANCGPTKLYGIEITKPRRNMADTTVPLSEVNEYRDAIIAIGTLAGFQFPDGISYWHKQQEVHSHVVTYTQPAFAAHGNDGFIPWHREFLHRYENLLREAYPRVTLFYWDWTTDPSLSARITGAMSGFSGGAIGAPLNVLFPPTINRYIGTYPTAPTPTATSDATVTAPLTFSGHSTANESPHNRSHTYTGGSGGTLTSPSTSTRDPFFFMLHGNADRLGAMWQRKNTSRLDPASVYAGSSSIMTEPMAPWNGLRYNGSVAVAGNPVNGISPWTAADGYITLKRADDHSVVFPPVYDTAPLTIPVLQAGESAVIEIPWYPPNPADFSCFGTDQGHVCLLARVETSTTSPFGMTSLEGANIDTNVRNNNNIVWKNVTVQDAWPGPLLLAPVWLRNVNLREIVTTRLDVRLAKGSEDLGRYGAILVDLKPELYARWVQNGAVGQGIERVGQNMLQIFGTSAYIGNLPLLPDEVQQVEVQVRLNPNYPSPEGRTFDVDLEQVGLPEKPDALVGGQRFHFDFNKLALVPKHGRWRYVDTGQYPGEGWPKPEFDDGRWSQGAAPLGYGDDVRTPIGNGRTPHPITTWYRHDFSLSDPTLYRSLWLRIKADDAAVVYLNGQEIYRLRLPAGIAITPTTPAAVEVEGVAEDTYMAVNVGNALALLQRGFNVLAVEVHQRSGESPDLCFDAELCANLSSSSSSFPPKVAFLTPSDGSLHLLGRPIPLSADAVDPLGSISAVTYLFNRQVLGVVQQSPYRMTWSDAPAGRHQIVARASDDQGNIGEAYLTVHVLSNLPPMVEITSPANDSVFTSADKINVVASALDIGGSIRQVDFYRKEHMHSFDEPEVRAGSSTTPPYAVDLVNLEPGHYFLYADATDNEGLTTRSGVVMIEVSGGDLRLTIQYMINHVMITRPVGSILQEADKPDGPWTDVPNAANPTMVIPLEKAKFYRAYVP
jgi:hypothetical protein